MKEVEDFENKLKELNNYSSPVDAKLWTNIESQIGGVAGASATSFVALKVAIISTAAALGIGSVWFLSKSDENEKTDNKIIKEQVLSDKNEEKQELPIQELKESKVAKSEVKQVSKKEENREILMLQKEAKEPNDLIPEEAKVTSPEPIRSIQNSNQNVDEKKVTESKKAENKAVSEDIKTNKEVKTEDNKPLVEHEWTELPNVFTPNNDGVNDFFFVEVKNLSDFSLVVMNDKNQVVWKTTDETEKWDGRNLSGEMSPKGNYLYYVSGKDPQGKFQTVMRKLSIR